VLVALRLRPEIAALTTLAWAALAASCDIFHTTTWQTRCEADPGSCPAAAGGAGGDGVASSQADGSGAGGSPPSGTGAASSVGPGGGGCPSSAEDCGTAADDDCDGLPNEDCGLILYLAFDEGAGTMLVDSSGNAHHGTHDALYVPGQKGTALEFDGARSGIVPGSPTFTWGAANEDFTVVYWIRLLAPPPGVWRSILHKGATDCGVGDRTSAHFLYPDSQSIHSAISTTFVASCNQEVINTPELPVGSWVQVASVKQGSTHTMYLNGEVVGSAAIQPVVANQVDLHLGKDPWYVGFIGNLDELQVYARALGQPELAALAL
jgi:hypothetical protein